MPAQPLPKNPSLENLRKQAKSFLKAVLANEPSALARLQEFHPRPDLALEDFSLSQAQLVIARSHGFASWSRPKDYLDTLTRHSFLPNEPDAEQDSEQPGYKFIRLACLNYLNDHAERHAKARELFAADPRI